MNCLFALWHYMFMATFFILLAPIAIPMFILTWFVWSEDLD